ncbi:MAG TPA: translation elongation factor Ts [Acidiferrobacterales bacterium]|nr:translation elongation factor Ts [Acidiferrobacterales bacterium]
MAITAAQVKELRERTGLGMMECKTALLESNGDMEAAIDALRKKAGARVEKKAGRIAAEGAIGIYLNPERTLAAMVEVNSETDFVAKGGDFIGFAQALAVGVAKENPADIDALACMPLLAGKPVTVTQARTDLVAKLGENIHVRRFVHYAANKTHIGSYLHGRKIGVLVEIRGGDAALARDIAMHIAASRPLYVSKAEVSPQAIGREKEIFLAQAQESGKPENIVEKMVAGRINKFINEVTLLGQVFVKDPEITVEKLLKSAAASVTRFCRYEVGEGIEKGVSDFAAEVMAQVKGG